MRVHTNITLATSTLMGICGLVILQPQMLGEVSAHLDLGNDVVSGIGGVLTSLCVGHEMQTVNPMFNELATTSGIQGMFGTFFLVFCAMLFGGAMIGTGMLQTITSAITHHVRGVRRVVTGHCRAQAYSSMPARATSICSVILGGNVFKTLYKRQRLEPRLLSRTVGGQHLGHIRAYPLELVRHDAIVGAWCGRHWCTCPNCGLQLWSSPLMSLSSLAYTGP